METPSPVAPRGARIFSLLAPPALALAAAGWAGTRTAARLRLAAFALAALLALTLAALAWRALGALRARRDTGVARTLVEQLDVLTASGAGLAWAGAAALACAAYSGWPSLSVVGLLGLGTVYAMVIYTCVLARGPDPWRAASLSRRFVPDLAVEGAPVREQLRFTRPRVPPGFRLLARGRVGARWPLARYALEEADAGGEVVLESELGPALRGEHRAPPLELWLQDIFGLCRSRVVAAGEARLTVLASKGAVEGLAIATRHLGFSSEARPAERLPSEGALRLREYQPGDDARRIHWVRSLSAGELVVRLPDELPRGRPGVTLALDSYLAQPLALNGALAAQDRATVAGALMDALVRVWLSVGCALAARGVRVTMLAAAPDGAQLAPRAIRLGPHSVPSLQTLGAALAWQTELTAAQLARASVRRARDEQLVVVSCRAAPPGEADGAARVLVSPGDWLIRPRGARVPAPGVLPFPMGSADNRSLRRFLEARRVARLQDEFDLLAVYLGAQAAPRAGDVLARPAPGGAIRVEVVS